jgi:adenosylcobinamide amidohydrolase
MKEFSLVGKGVKLILKENVLAVISENPLTTISSAFYNGGGIKKTKVILNVEVLKSCSDQDLHGDPSAYILASSKKFGIQEEFIGMVTAAAVDNFALVSKKQGGLAVSVVATAADKGGNTCNFAESAGEPIEIQPNKGTINIIVVIDGNPIESCLAGTLITVTEAKMAALRELDVRSRFSGDEATGTVTDSIVVAKTNAGVPIAYGGPASKLGQMVGYCAKKAVKTAVTKANEFLPSRSIRERLKERHISLGKLAFELSKVDEFKLEESTLEKILEYSPIIASIMLAAVKIDDDIKKGLIPSEFGKIEALSESFGHMFSEIDKELRDSTAHQKTKNYAAIELPPFTKQVLINIIRSVLSKNKTENLK